MLMTTLAEAERALDDAVRASELFIEKLKQLPPIEVMRSYYRLKIAAEGLHKLTKKLNVIKTSLQYGVVPETMIAAKIRNHTDDELLVRFGMSTRTTCKIIDKPLAYDWLRSEGQGDIITETVNSQTLGAFAKSFIDTTGRDLPEDAFEVKAAIGATVTKVSVKK